MLDELVFPSLFVSWVMQCVQSVSYFILINGVPTTPVPAQKGLRKGDSISPFVFAIGMEYLLMCLADLSLNSDFNYHSRCEKLGITHMMFADDMLLLTRADVISVKLLY